ncbi:hypothetical protein LCGC14_0987300 [marine sediment metagenome]|uniref:Uncharacterized protein n=1 Tax=marine sediment metagenome TaxID=412755 RepID=A0A0F9NBG8_9ZZZZ
MNVNAGEVCEVCGSPAAWHSSTPDKPPQHFLCTPHSNAWARFTSAYHNWYGYVRPGTRVNRARWEETFEQFLVEYQGTVSTWIRSGEPVEP